MLDKVKKYKLILILSLVVGIPILFLWVWIFIDKYQNNDSNNIQLAFNKEEIPDNDHLLPDQQLHLYGVPETIIESCHLEDRALSDESELYPILEYDEEIIGVGELSVASKIKQDRIYILYKGDCSIKVIEHPLAYRPISSIEKVSKDKFSFTYTAQPHYGYYYEYDTNGSQINKYPLIDECYLINQVPEELRERYEEICKTNPILRPFSEFPTVLKI